MMMVVAGVVLRCVGDSVIYWRWCQQPCTLAVTADESGWGITIYSAVVIGEVVAAGGGD